ncbi:MAG: cellulase family glycosylhydrolase [Planctomycetota bacterium]|jgi:hypothetical protein
MKRRVFLVLVVVVVLAGGCSVIGPKPSVQWTAEQAKAWYEEKPWLVGCNYTASTAINQLEMWQLATFDEETIERELAWDEELGFTSVRVYLHHLLWRQHARGLLQRMERFLRIADRHNIGVMFVLLDGVWDPFPQLGDQRDPKPHVHNSGWVQSPGVKILRDPERHAEVRGYIKGVVGHFRKDRRVHAWDVFNEPDNMNRPAYEQFEPDNKAELALTLLEKAFAWVREAAPTQPITAAVWSGDWSSDEELSAINRFMLEQSDVITFHCYSNLDRTKACVESLRRYNRPIICTEYMARPAGSTFEDILPYFKEQKVGAYNWGFVAGKTQTVYPWDSWRKPYTAEPPVWFHDIFRQDGTPFDPNEAALIKKLTGKQG